MIGRQEQSSDGLPGGSVVKNTPANAGDAKDAVSISGSGDALEDKMATHSGNPMDRGAWWAAVQGATKSQTRQSD